ncbi:amidohydrolase family protein [Rhodococcoides fascians]|uniref:amidohydrolase family protein n=1 Tax=Rhodococcoides fascians TaxID=1828 RepID=UPI0005674808|nr:amidohydrolase family protein [Rhodococcus fascians]
MSGVSRRTALLGGLAAAVGGSTALASCARAQTNETQTDQAKSGAMLIRNARAVLTMDPNVGDSSVGESNVGKLNVGELNDVDILIESGRIAQIGAGLQQDGADEIDASGSIVMPGLVDTHWHMWNSIARGFGQTSKGGFAPSMASISPLFTASDSALGVRLALAEAVSAGITTVHNWAHNVRSPEHAEAEAQAMTESGVRGRFAYGYPQDLGADQPMDLDHLRSWSSDFPDGLISLGICARGPDRSEDAVWQQEWDVARSLGLPITTHMASDAAAAALGGIAKLDARGGLGPDVQLVHLTAATPADLETIARTRTAVSISPWTELQVGYGLPPIAALRDSGVTLGLSVDNTVLSGTADMFEVMKLTADLPGGMQTKQGTVTDASVLDWATATGARSIGFGDSAGVLAVGRPADIILVDADALNTAPVYDATSLAVRAARPSNVSFVMIDGVVHKRDHELVRVDTEALLSESDQAIRTLRDRAGF